MLHNGSFDLLLDDHCKTMVFTLSEQKMEEFEKRRDMMFYKRTTLAAVLRVACAEGSMRTRRKIGDWLNVR